MTREELDEISRVIVKFMRIVVPSDVGFLLITIGQRMDNRDQPLGLSTNIGKESAISILRELVRQIEGSEAADFSKIESWGN